MTGDLEALVRYAGQGAALVREILPAGGIVRRMAAEAERIIATLADGQG
jgi:NAD(P)H-dependent flavin oxidoreductase YrpB (nitropropane dioxygenase family)